MDISIVEVGILVGTLVASVVWWNTCKVFHRKRIEIKYNDILVAVSQDFLNTRLPQNHYAMATLSLMEYIEEYSDRDDLSPKEVFCLIDNSAGRLANLFESRGVHIDWEGAEVRFLVEAEPRDNVAWDTAVA